MTSITKSPFGKMPSGRDIFMYTLINKNGLEMKVINYGGSIHTLKTPDKNGVIEDIVLGYETLEGYLGESLYFGALIGRYGNRIAEGKITLEDTVYNLVKSNGSNCLHGGNFGFDKVVWEIEEIARPDGPALKLTYFSKDGEEGFPGNLNVEVIYTLTDTNELKVDYQATTDKTTVVCLTQHSYFNLTGNLKGDILNHELIINADEIVPVNKVLIPTGELRNVAGTPFDFTTPHTIGSRIKDKNDQLEIAGGYDHCFVLRDADDSLRHAATLIEPVSGRSIDVYTTEPGLQLYSGNFLSGSVGKGGIVYNKGFALCLESEHFPDSPNQPQFPSTVLKPGEVYSTSTVYKFGVINH